MARIFVRGSHRTVRRHNNGRAMDARTERHVPPGGWASIKRALKPIVVNVLFRYRRADLVAALRRLGIQAGDSIMVHASWLPYNGFQGGPADFVAGLQEAVGPDGLLTMPSMTYHNESSAEFLARGRPMDVRRSPSRMGLLTEVFRRSPGVRRSLSPTHPVLAWGRDAACFLEGHDAALVPFGPDSPFGRLLARNGKVLLIDAPFATVTFTHFLEDRIADRLPVPLYEPDVLTGTVIDDDGAARQVPVRAIASAANRARREDRLLHALEADGIVRRSRIGNTALQRLDCSAMTACVDRMAAAGKVFFDAPAGPTATAHSGSM